MTHICVPREALYPYLVFNAATHSQFPAVVKAERHKNKIYTLLKGIKLLYNG